jgi:diguanylate cyclase (GGDEF)-like protein/PAS domain S-box-containing protein
MERKQRVILVFLGVGVLFWMTEALLDFLFSSGKPFLDSLGAGLYPHQLATRLGGAAFFVAFGLWFAKLLSDRSGSETEIGHLHAVLNGIHRVNHLISRETGDLDGLLRGICRELREPLGFPQVFVALVDLSRQAVTRTAHAGFVEFERNGAPHSSHHEQLLAFSGTLPAQGRMILPPENSPEGNGFFLRPAPGCGLLCVPLIHNGEKLGVIAVSTPQAQARNPRVISLFREIAGDIAGGVHKAFDEERRLLQAWVLDDIRGYVTVTDLHGNIVYVNHAVCKDLKYSGPELLGKPVSVFGERPERGSTQREIIERTLKDGDWHGRVVNVAADGTEIAMECRTWLVRDREGTPRYLAGISHDTADCKGVEDELAESQRKMESLLDNLPGMFYRCRNNADWEMLFISDGCYRLTGYEPEELLGGKGVTYGSIIHPDDRQWIWETIQKKTASGQPFQFEYRIRRKDGSERWVWEQGRVVPENGPQEAVLEGLILDVTARRQAQESLRESEARFRRAQRIAHVGSWEFDLQRGIVWASEEACRIYGLEEQQQEERSIAAVQKIPLPEFRPFLDQAMQDLIESGQPYEVDFRIRRPTDDMVIDIHSVAEFDPLRQLVLGALQDVTRQREGEARLQQTSATLEALYRASPLPLVALDTQGRVTHWSLAAEKMFGWKEEEVLGRPLPIFPDNRQREVEKIQSRLLDGESIAGLEQYPFRRDGNRIPALLFASPFRDSGNRISGAALVLMDVTEQRKLQKRMAYLAYHDPLTGLSNRGHLKERFNQEMSRAYRTKTRIALCLIDLDRFKLVNDTFGHPAGDELLCQIAVRLLGFVRGTDLVCRPGGDEFLVMLNDIKDLDALTVVARKIQNLFADSFLLEGKSFKITASIGISVYPDDGTNIHQLFKNADNAMYHAKEMGSNNFQFYRKEMDNKVRDRMFLENGLRHAADNGELFLSYQPQVDLVSGRVVGAEALLRWRHPDQGLIEPERFIPVAEDTGMIIPIGQWVIRGACRQLREWREAGLAGMALSVNLSTVQLFDEGFCAWVEKEMRRNDVGSGSLAFELTESVFMRDRDNLREKILKLKNLGIEFHLDDFGTGYSSLSYLKMFQVDKLKIDKSFIRDITHDASDLTLVVTMIQMAHNLGIKVIAEGVETQEQLDLLASHCCDQYQGFFCSHPLPSPEFNRYLRKEMKCGCPGDRAK